MSWMPGLPVTLTTTRYIVRSLIPADVSERMLEWAGDPVVMQTLNRTPRASTREQMQRYIQQFDNQTRFLLGIVCRDSRLLIGYYAVYCDLRNRTATTNVVIGDHAYWGQKVVLETRAALLDFLYDTLDLHKVLGYPLARNFPAIFNYKAQGFRCEGVLREQVRAAEGDGWLDQYVFGLLRREWHARQREEPA